MGGIFIFSLLLILLMIEKQLRQARSNINLDLTNYQLKGLSQNQMDNTIIMQQVMICINPKRNPKLLETFNNDPYSDITIKTTTSQLHLVLGYLSIDSQYFDDQLPDVGVIDLSHLHENSLIKILRALYGQELNAYNVRQLGDLYVIIQFLKINEYRENIVKYIEKNQQLMDNFELIQFCFSNHILQEEIRKHHFQRNLSVFASTKNYLQLNKIRQNTLNSLLVQYSDLKGQEGDSTINSIIENYIGRNDLRPNQYFIQPGIEHLLSIWEKYHHSISYLISAQEKVRQSQILNEDVKKSMIHTSYSTPLNNPIPSLSPSPSIGISTSIGASVMVNQKANYLASTVNTAELHQKDLKIQELEKTIELNNQIIQTLKMQIESAKKQAAINANVKKPSIILPDDEKISDSTNQRRHEFEDVLGNGHGDYDVSLIEPPFNQVRKIVNEDAKELKTMNKLNTRTKKIFN